MSLDLPNEEAPPPPPIRPAVSFWREPMVQNFLPLATSIVLHGGLIVLLVLLVRALPPLLRATREQIIIPEAAMIDGTTTGGIPNPGLGGDPNLSASQNTDPNVATADNWAQQRSQSLNTTLLGGSSDATDSVIGLGAKNSVAGTGDDGVGGAGGEKGGPLAAFGVGGGGTSIGPKSPFMGISGNARRVVYICDASGSMMDVFWRVKVELKKAVDVLKPIQAFNVVFFSDIDVNALNKKELVMATPAMKRKAFELSESMSSAGTTDPLPAIRLAFSQQPELIYILTDGFDNVVSFDDVINEFRKLNAAKKVRVNTILLRSSANPELEKVVRTIASENGGICKIIDRHDL